MNVTVRVPVASLTLGPPMSMPRQGSTALVAVLARARVERLTGIVMIVVEVTPANRPRRPVTAVGTAPKTMVAIGDLSANGAA